MKIRAVVVMSVLTASTFSGNTMAATTSSSTAADAASFLNVLKASAKAEDAKDANTFLKLWTDKGLSEYDVGSRSDIAAGKSDNFGADPATVLNYGKPVITAKTATVDIQATIGASTFAQPIFLVTFKGLKQNGKWLLNGFEFKGSPPTPVGTDVVEVTALNYAFSLNKATAKRNLGFHFVNKTTEAHEMTFFKTPTGVTLAQAKTALENVTPVGVLKNVISCASVVLLMKWNPRLRLAVVLLRLKA